MSRLKRIYDLEVTPPEDAWKHIAQELDEAVPYKPLAQTLENLEVTPPAGLWSKINSQLDENIQEKNMAEKLYSLESEPPAAAWEHIQQELDDQKALEILEKKLSGMQVTPPRSAWEEIKTQLDKKDHQGLVVPMHHGWLKYAAAACFVAIVSITSFFIFSDSDNSPNGMTAATDINKPEAIPVAKQQPSAQSSREQGLASIRTKLGNAYAVSMETNSDLQNRYIVLMTEEGNIVRMSKKVSNMADCIAGEDESCNDLLSKWQKEMANNATAAGPDNFLDILDIASSEDQTIIN